MRIFTLVDKVLTNLTVWELTIKAGNIPIMPQNDVHPCSQTHLNQLPGFKNQLDHF